jgi:two-component system response regulator HydG
MSARILVVDDEESIRFTLKQFLLKEGHDVLTVGDHAAALKAISGEVLDLIFADIILGDRTGVDILRVVKERGLTCPVIMITGFPNLETGSEALRLGAFDYLAKPVRKEQILRATQMALNHKQALDQRKLAETKQEDTRRYLEAVFRSVTDAIITVDKDMIVTGTNESTRNICGLDPEMAVGRRFESSFNLCQKACRKALEQILLTKEAVEDPNILCGHRHRPNQVVALTGTRLRDSNDNFLGAVLVLKDKTRLTELERELEERGKFHNIIGKSRRMQKIYQLIEDLSDVETTVLIQGESGTGKELIAEAIHYSGNRSARHLIKVNCAALTENLLESELFGHVKGAFTGAVKDRAGRFQLAEGGTIFLDEIGEMPLTTQVKLLRVLEEKTFEPVGDSNAIKADIRIIASTNSDLTEKTEKGEFRKDLYYRLKVLEIPLPPLRERRQDIPLLIEHFCNTFRKQFGKSIDGISDKAVHKLMAYAWPGNVRELKHAIEHAFIVCHDRQITLDHLPLEIVDDAKKLFQSAVTEPLIDPQHISKALEESQGNKSEAARRLGISRQTIYRKIKKL